MKNFKNKISFSLVSLIVFIFKTTTAQNVLPYLPEVNGSVVSILIKGDTGFIAGGFTTVGGNARRNLAAINVRTGAVLNWDPNPFSGVQCLATDSKSILFTGGNLAMISAQPRTAIAAIDAFSGIATNWNPVITNTVNSRSVRTLVYADNKLFIHGDFDTINGQAISPRDKAVLDANTGQVISGYTLNSSAYVYTALAANNTLFVGGDFGTIRGYNRPALASFNISSNTVNNWSPAPDGRVNKMLLVGEKLYIGGRFGILGAGFKHGLTWVDTATGQPGNWNPLPSGSRVVDMGLAGNDMYVIREGTNALENFDINSGAKTDTWYPNNVMSTIASYGDTVLVGGAFTKVGWVNRSYLFAVTKGLSLGVNNVNASKKITVYPNPASTHISFSLNESPEGTIILRNVLGETMRTEPTRRGNKQQEVNTYGLPAGLYLITIITGDRSYIGKFSKE